MFLNIFSDPSAGKPSFPLPPHPVGFCSYFLIFLLFFFVKRTGKTQFSPTTPSCWIGGIAGPQVC